MQRAELLKKMLPGFIPLFVFIAIDEIWGTKAGLIAALAIGTGELVWIGIREKRFDRFVLFDTLLLLALGGVSLLLNNDIFFKLKPGLVELILCAVLALSAFSKVNVVALMSKRYMKEIELSDVQTSKMRDSLKFMFFVFLIHTLLVFYAAFYMSDGAWAFISGGLFYMLFGLVFLYELFRQKRNRNQLMNEEQLPVVDESGKVRLKKNWFTYL
jgi:intracellular septation protein A